MLHNPAVHDPLILERVFNGLFAERLNTVLRGGADEPLYRPGEPNVILYREDYFASALHEIAHWCVAGTERRKLVDFGYWYEPDGRSAERQAEFEQVEVKPQALEWVFADACGWDFRLSADNFEAGLGPSDEFAAAVSEEKARMAREGLPVRAGWFVEGLVGAFSGEPA